MRSAVRSPPLSTCMKAWIQCCGKTVWYCLGNSETGTKGTTLLYTLLSFCLEHRTVYLMWGCVSIFFCSHSFSGTSLPVPAKSILCQYLANKDVATISAKSMPSRHILVATHGGIIISLIKAFLVSECARELLGQSAMISNYWQMAEPRASANSMSPRPYLHV